MQNEIMAEDIKEILQFKYFIGSKDLYYSKFPFNKVLQTVWAKDKSYVAVKANEVISIFKGYIHRNLPRFRTMQVLAVNLEVYAKVLALQNEFPECFKEVGWWTKEMLGEYYLQGRLVVDGSPVTPEDVDNRMLKYVGMLEDIERKIQEEEKLILEDRRLRFNEAIQTWLENHRQVQVGDTFRNKTLLLEAYKDITNGIKGPQEKLKAIQEYIDVSYTGSKWEVAEIKKEDTICRYPTYEKPDWTTFS